MPKREDVEDALWFLFLIVSILVVFALLYEVSYLIFPEGTLGR